MIEKAALHPVHVGRLTELRKAIYDIKCDFDAQVAPSAEPVPFCNIDKLTYFPIKKGQVWATCDNSERYDCAWFKFTANIPDIKDGDKVVALIDINGEGLVYRDGKILRGITQVLSGIDYFQSRKGKQVVELDGVKSGDSICLTVDAGFNGKRNRPGAEATFNRACVAVLNTGVYDMYYDYLQAFCLALTYPDNENMDKSKQANLLSALNKAYAAYKGGKVADARAIISKARDNNEADGQDSKINYTAIGHAHLDLAWLWPVRETKRKAARTLSTALANIDKYPDYIFGVSQAQMLQWIKEDYPQLFERIRAAVKDGRIALQGGMWVESDCNLPCAESLIRQFVYGGKFFEEEFGVNSEVVWLPDVFGYAANMPQIILGCGKKYFMTIKLTWNTVNKFPYKSFVWKGIDGSEVLSHMAPQGDYNSTGSPFAVVKSDKGYAQKDKLKDALLIYGIGDGGGGPGEGHLELISRQSDNSGLSRVNTGSDAKFFEKLSKYEDIPIYDGELYLEKHRGTYTSQAAIKKGNRTMERLLHEIEWLAANALARGIEYDKSAIDRLWKETLLYQFHDILPGSSVKRVYDECAKGYSNMTKTATELRDKLICVLSDKPSETLESINASPFEREEYFKRAEGWYVAKCPAYGVGKCVPYMPSGKVSCEKNKISNGIIDVEFGRRGEIISLKDCKSGREYCKKYLNKLIVFSDPKMYYNAWDIRPNYRKLIKGYPRLVACNVGRDGARAVRENVYSYGSSKIIQEIYVEDGKDTVTVKTRVSWHERYKMLRAEFMPTVYGDKVNCDVQMGNYDRSTREDDSREKAQFEICAHKFVNVDGDNAGIAVLNDCKYGYRVKGGIISLNLLRSPKSPDPTCDMGEHTFTYVIYPHEGCWQDSDVVRHGYALNNPLIAAQSRPNITRFINYKQDNVILETVKPAEDGKGIVVRLYERWGRESEISPVYDDCITDVFECDMRERIIGKADKKLAFSPYKIKTLYLRLR